MNLAKVYANERKAFGKPIGKAFQGCRFPLRRHACPRSRPWSSSPLRLPPLRRTPASAALLTPLLPKLFATEARCPDLHSGSAGIRRQRLQQGVRRQSVSSVMLSGWCVMEGSTEILRMIVSGTVLA